MHSSLHLRLSLLVAASLLLVAGAARAEEDFLAAVNAADGDRDGFVTRNELIGAYAGKYPDRSHGMREQFADAVLAKFDANHDGKISRDEIAAMTPKQGLIMVVKENPDKAALVMAAITRYRKEHGVPAQTLAELVKEGMVSEEATKCRLWNGKLVDWGYTPVGQKPLDPNGVLLYSPGPIDEESHYVVGIGEKGVFIAFPVDLDMSKAPVVKLTEHALAR